jgi:hypothetical protein
MSHNKVMSWSEAIAAMEKGKVVRNEYFTREEWFEMRSGRIFAEDGCPMDGWYRNEGWQNTGWSVIADPRSA